MALRSLLKKELRWSRRNATVFLFLVVVIPGFLAGTSVLFQDLVPRNAPVAVVPADDTVSQEDLETVAGTIDSFTDPTVLDSQRQAQRQLERESVYGIVVVPPDMTAPDANVTVGLLVDGNVAPFHSPSQVIDRLMAFHLDRTFDATVSTDREVQHGLRDLPEYLYPTFLMTIVIFVAFTYVPLIFEREASVMDRVRIESSLEALVATKLLFLTGLMAVPIGVFHLAAVWYGYDIDSLDPGAVLVLLVTFFLLASVSTTVMVLSRFSTAGRFVNLAVMLGLLALSALAFPLGFFSTARTVIAQLLPTHYAMIIVRSLMLKDTALVTFLDWIGVLLALCLLSVFALEGALVYYRRWSR